MNRTRISRQVPRWSELRPLLSFERPGLPDRAHRLQRAADIGDLRRIAQRRTPKAAFDYVDGAALSEQTARGSRRAFDAVELIPRVLRGIGEVDLRVRIAGGESALPMGIAPTGFTRFMHSEGEDAGAAAARRFDIPFSLSTMGTRSVEQVAEVSGEGRRWFQLYLWKDRRASEELVRRAWETGYDTLLVTADTPVAGLRLRDTRNGMTIPPKLRLSTVLDASYRPEWWLNFLSTDPLSFASLSGSGASLPEVINSMFEPTLDFEDLEWIRSVWPGKLFLKGVLGVEDAQRAVAAGADGVVVSSHGGRQLDRVVQPLRALPRIREALGPDAEIIYDSGVLSGTDAIIALALGADFTLIGRAYLYGLMAGGQEGVERALELLEQEMRVTMHLLGVATVDELHPGLITGA